MFEKLRSFYEIPPAEVNRAVPRQYKLTGWKCKNCGTVFVTKRLVCRECKGRELEETPLSGRGKIHTFNITKIPQVALRWVGYYPIAIVELEEGGRAIAQLIECKDEDIKIGMEVEATVRRIKEEQPGIALYMYKFRPARK